MGDAPSKDGDDGRPGGEPFAESNRPKASKLHEDFQRTNVDSRDAFEAAFAGETGAMEEITRIVQQLEGLQTEEQKEARKLQSAGAAVEALQAQRLQERRDKGAEQEGGRSADDWMERQLAEGRRVVERAAAERERKRREEAEARRAEAQAEAQAEARAAAKAAALRELEAREALRKDASVAAERLLDEAQRDAQRAKLLAEGLAAMPLPVAPPELPAEEVPPPPLPKPKRRASRAKVPEYYALLDVGVDATYDEIRKGYRRQALIWHPDKNRGQQEEATERFKRITLAFDTLFDPGRREAYDAGTVDPTKRKAKKLTGAGWANLADEDDAVLTVQGFKYKRGSWTTYVYLRGRIDDVEPIWDDPDHDPRAPQQKIKVFWRYLGQLAYEAKQEAEGDASWLPDFVTRVWKDTPARWPRGVELEKMSDVARGEWKERRMVFNRRREKILLNIQLHKTYLAIPNRLQKEKERMQRSGLISKVSNPALASF